MTQFTLPLQKDRQRPIVFLDYLANSYVMLDTGALFPVWCGDEDVLKKIGGTPLIYDQSFGGFGGSARGTVYKLPKFRLGQLIFPNLPVIASRYNLPCQMIMSATMFSGLIYEIDNGSHRLNVTVPDKESNVRNLTVEDRNGRLHVLCTGGC